MVCIAMNVKITAKIYAHRIYKNVQISLHQMDITGEYDVTLIVIVLMFYIFYHVTLARVIQHRLEKL